MNKTGRIAIVAVLVVAVAVVIVFKPDRDAMETAEAASGGKAVVPQARAENQADQPVGKGLPALIDLGAGKCIPCKMMAPILEELKEEYAGRLKVEFIDVWENPDAGREYGIKLIPTQIFYDASGKELFRHEGFYSKEDILAKWKEFGVDLTTAELPAFERLAPAKTDDRPKESICYMCDGDITSKTLVTVRTDKGPVRLCSPHCYFIMYSCLTEDKAGFEKKVSVADSAAGKLVPATEAAFLCGQDETTGRPWTKAFADRSKAVKERSAAGGSILALAALQEKELSGRCGFCDRACYTQDAAKVIVQGGLHTWGCCSHCALGVAARTGKDIDRFLKELHTDYLDIVLLHCVDTADWPETRAGAMETLARKKQEGIIRAHGVSCHSFGALERAAQTPWAQIVLARINHAGQNMDDTPEKVVPVLERIAATGAGVYGMKVLACGSLGSAAGDAIDFVLGIPAVHAITVGMSSRREVDENIRQVEAYDGQS